MALKIVSKKQTLTGALVALVATPTFGLELVNYTGADLSFTLNGGDTVIMPSPSKEYFPEIVNTSEIMVKGTGDVFYYIFPTA